MDPQMIMTLLPLGQKLLEGIMNSSDGEKNAISELLTGLLGKITTQPASTTTAAGTPTTSAAQGALGAVQQALSGNIDSQIFKAVEALVAGHSIELDMTLKVRPKG